MKRVLPHAARAVGKIEPTQKHPLRGGVREEVVVHEQDPRRERG